MLAAFLEYPANMTFSSLMLVASAAAWIVLTGTRTRLAVLSVLLLMQSANTALAAMTTHNQFQLPVLGTLFLVLTLQWILIAVASVPGSSGYSEPAEGST